jgi:hypothetical protein
MIFLTKEKQNKGRLNSFKVKNLCICFPLLSNFIRRGKELLNFDICTVLCTDTHV